MRACLGVPGSTGCQPVVAGGPAGNILFNAISRDAISWSWQVAETYRLGSLCSPGKLNCRRESVRIVCAEREFSPITQRDRHSVEP